MKPKMMMKIVIDLGMTVLLLLLMTYELIGQALHEWLGIGMFVLLILHHILNGTWSRNISVHVVDGKAVHTPGNCQTCLACAHACPQKAIQMTVPEANPVARYRNEHITLQEIIEANCQI